jgi:dolichol-phosphate mannosyltransferase
MDNNETFIDFSILIPAFNEAGNIIFTLQETIKVLQNFNSHYEILVIDDGSTDSTFNLVKSFSEQNQKVKIEGYFPNSGKGSALRYGFSFLKGRYILFLDADLDLHPSQLANLYGIMQKNNADVVIGSKKNKDSVLNYPRIRKLFSSSYYLLIKFLFHLPIKDNQTGIKLFRYEVLKNCLPLVSVNRYAYDLELLLAAHRKGYKILEAPIKLDMKRKSGRIGFGDALNVFKDTVRIFWRFYIKKYYNN